MAEASPNLPAAAAAEPAAEPPAPPNFLYGPFAGVNLQKGSSFNIMFGCNAGRHLISANHSVIIGDNIYGKRGKTSRFVSISDEPPNIPDSHLESAIVNLRKLLQDIKQFEGEIPSNTLEQVVTVCSHFVEIYAARLRILNSEWTTLADKDYIKKATTK